MSSFYGFVFGRGRGWDFDRLPRRKCQFMMVKFYVWAGQVSQKDMNLSSLAVVLGINFPSCLIVTESRNLTR